MEERDDLINGLKHMADDHECCRGTIELAIEALQINIPENIGEFLSGKFLAELKSDEEFVSFVKAMPENYWAKYDLSAVRLGWEAYRFIKDSK